MSHRLLRNDPGAESKSSLEESILEVVMDLGLVNPKSGFLYVRDRGTSYLGRTRY